MTDRFSYPIDAISRGAKHKSDFLYVDDVPRNLHVALRLDRHNSSSGVGRVSAIGWIFDSKQGAVDRLIPRWIFLRALGFIYFSAFYSLAFQIKGLIGPNGILPAGVYLE